MKRLEELLEKLAEIEHEQWVSWSKAIAQQEKISERRLKRWRKLWIPYEQLPEEIKEEDRIWARKVIEVIKQHINGSKANKKLKKACEEGFKLAVLGHICDSAITTLGVSLYGACNEGNIIFRVLFENQLWHIYLAHICWDIIGIAGFYFWLLPKCEKHPRFAVTVAYVFAFILWIGFISWVLAFGTGNVVYCK